MISERDSIGFEQKFLDYMKAWEEGQRDPGVAVRFIPIEDLVVCARWFGLDNKALVSHRGYSLYGLQYGSAIFEKKFEVGFPKNGDDFVLSFEWNLSSNDGPYQYISLNPPISDRPDGNLSLGFSLNGSSSLTRSINYSQEGGVFKFDQMNTFNFWRGRLSPYPSNPEVNLVEEIIEGNGKVKLIARDDGGIVEVMTFPASIEATEWIERFEDRMDQLSTDPDLPWRDWFNDLGITFNSIIPNPNA